MAKHIPEGYKQTEVGVIPEDWEERKLGALIKFEGGSQPPLYTFINKPKKGYIRLVQIRDFKSEEFRTYIPDQLARKVFKKDDIMIGRYGPPIFQIFRGLEGAYNVALIKALPVDKLEKDYAYHFLKQNKLFLFVEKFSQRTGGQTGIDIQELKNYPFPIPNTTKEQKAIATALSDVDNLITSLEQLIEKKKAIKQGTMQELLTGKRRLKGFGEGKGYKQTELGMIPEDWEVKRLHELGEFQSGIGFPLYLQGKHQEVIPFYKVSDMNNNGNEVLMLNSNNYISKKDLVKLRTTIVPRSSIVFAKIGAALFLERKRILLVDSLIDNNMMAIIADIDNIDVKYLYYLLMNTKFSKYANTTALPSINRNDIGEIKFKIPSLHEQEAITQVLTNMDSEIEKLESKVDKYKQIKQGMMQNLLTGRIRLV
jgi:type I restriction enzyme S subunit